ncbi:MAG: NADH:ubiquinone oxidoreductase [bacterium]
MNELAILRKHGRQSVTDLRKAIVPAPFRGRPVISADLTMDEAEKLTSLCPSGAIRQVPFSMDLGKCEFCGECAFLVPGKITFTSDHRIATNNREQLVLRPGTENPILVDPEKTRKEIRAYFRHALKLRQVSAGGDNSAEMELNACGNVNFDMGRFGIEFVASPRHADGLVITGPVTANMSEPLRICYEAVPDPKIVILAGTAAISGGIFRESSALDRNFIDSLHIDLFVPGNPPHPLTFINGILDLIGK